MGPEGNEPWHDLPLARTAFNALCAFPQTQRTQRLAEQVMLVFWLLSFSFLTKNTYSMGMGNERRGRKDQACRPLEV